MAVSISQRMNVDLVAKTFTITSTTTHGAETGVGILSIQTPTGTVMYSNTDFDNPDIDTIDGTSDDFACPLDVDGNMLSGTYTVSLTIKDDSDVEYTDETEYDMDYTAPVVTITQTPDGYASTFKSEDTTDYTGFTAVRTHEITVPVGSTMVDVSTSSAAYTISANIWSGVYVTDVSTDITYVNGLLNVTDTVTGTETVTVYKVDKDTIYNAVEAFNTTYNTLLGTNPTLAKTYQNIAIRTNMWQQEYQSAVDSGNTRKAYEALVNISEVLSPDFIDDLFTTTEEITPFSTATQLDHSHDNLSVLALLSESSGELYYDGSPIVNSTTGQVKVDSGDTLEYLESKVDDTTIEINGSNNLAIKDTYPSTIIDDDWIVQDGNDKLTVDESKLTEFIGSAQGFQIILSAGVSVAARVAGGDTVVPTGWSVSDVNTYDLEITHTALDKNLAFCTVWSKSGSTYTQLMSSAAYTGLNTNATTNVSVIQSLATYNSILKIDLIFI